MKLKKIIASYLLGLVLVLPQAVLAEDFTFDFNLEFSNLHPDVAKIRIFCATLKPTGGDTIGSGQVEVVVPADGAVNKNVLLAFNASPGQSLSDAKFYRCAPQFIKLDGTSGFPRPSNFGQCQESSFDWLCAKPGSPFAAGEIGGVFEEYQ